MNKISMMTGLLVVGLSAMGCATTNRDVETADARAQECGPVQAKPGSAWIHGEGAPGGQAQIGYGRSMETVSKRQAMARDTGSVEVACSSDFGTRVR